MGLGGLSLADVFRQQARAGVPDSGSHKALINVFLAGGPPHTDMFDLKPDAPVEYRGEFSPIATRVPARRTVRPGGALPSCKLLPMAIPTMRPPESKQIRVSVGP